jgi:type I restriction enzyme R subunit
MPMERFADCFSDLEDLIDAVGVTESRKTVAPPLDRDHAIAFDRLLDNIAAGDRRDDTLSTSAACLAALDRRIDSEARTDLAKAAGGLTLADLAGGLIDAIDPDIIEQASVARTAPRRATNAGWPSLRC